MHVSDGVDDGQVALPTGQAVEGHLSTWAKEEDPASSSQRPQGISIEADAVEDGSQETDDLQGCHVVGDEVGVAGGKGAPLLPPLAANMEDGDKKREEKQEVHYGERGEYNAARCGVKAAGIEAIGRNMWGVKRHVGTLEKRDGKSG